MSQTAEPAVREFVYWRRERDALGRGLRQLRQLRQRALADPEFAARTVADGLLAGDIEIVPDEHDTVPSDEDLAADYYSKLIAAYERQVVEAQRNTWAAETQGRMLAFAPRAYSPLRQRTGRARRLVVRITGRRRLALARLADDDEPDPVDDREAVA
jgi:hypothetical protein